MDRSVEVSIPFLALFFLFSFLSSLFVEFSCSLALVPSSPFPAPPTNALPSCSSRQHLLLGAVILRLLPRRGHLRAPYALRSLLSPLSQPLALSERADSPLFESFAPSFEFESDTEHCHWFEPVGRGEDKYWPECRVCSSEQAVARAMALERLDEGEQRL
jgi:hypothetical protein